MDSLLLEGHCFEAGSGNPPRGLQLTLGTATNPTAFDTIVMANLGYLQSCTVLKLMVPMSMCFLRLKTFLDILHNKRYLNLREGRSEELYKVVSYENIEVGGGCGRDLAVLMNR